MGIKNKNFEELSISLDLKDLSLKGQSIRIAHTIVILDPYKYAHFKEVSR